MRVFSRVDQKSLQQDATTRCSHCTRVAKCSSKDGNNLLLEQTVGMIRNQVGGRNKPDWAKKSMLNPYLFPSNHNNTTPKM